MRPFSAEGTWVAVATPFRADGALDEPAFRRLCGRLRDGGVSGLVVLGSTGEAATLEEDERDRLIAAALDAARGIPIMAGCGSNATRVVARWTRRARELGAHAALVVTPYYNKPTPEGVYAHFAAAADAAPDLPLVAYNVPGRTGLNLAPSTLARLWTLPTVVAVKESSGNLAQIGEIARTLPAGKTLLAGDDQLALASIAVGARGLVSVVGNVKPRETADLVAAAVAGDMERARRIHAALLPLMDALFLEPNPIPVKAALAQQGVCGATMRLPLTEATAATKAKLAELLGAPASSRAAERP
jgi:4-hydroxy-tetrahydrodipicolinate synthase